MSTLDDIKMHVGPRAHRSGGKEYNFIKGMALPSIDHTKGDLYATASAGTPDVTTQPTFFYSPELTPDVWLLPKGRIEELRWCQIHFNLNPYVHSIINMHARYPFSNFRLKYKDAKIEQQFNSLLFKNKSFDWYDFILQMSLSYWKYGESVVFGDWSEAEGTWNYLTLLPPTEIDYREDTFSGEISIEMIPTTVIKNKVRDALLQGRVDIHPALIDAVQNNKKIPLDTKGREGNIFTGELYSPPKAFVWARVQEPGEVRGSSIIKCLFKDLIFADKIRLAQMACAAGDTKIKLLNGQVRTIEDLYNSKEHDFWVYSCTEKGEIVYKKANKVVCNGKKQLYKITLDNGESLRFTADHPFMMRNGTWKEVKDLKPGDSLMPLYIRERRIGVGGMYDQVYSPLEDKWAFVHRLVQLEGKFKGCVIHHKNFDRKDNTPENLVPMTHDEHHHMHRDLTIRRQPELQKAVQAYRQTTQYKEDLLKTRPKLIASSKKRHATTYKTGVRYKLLTSIPDCGYYVVDCDTTKDIRKRFLRVAKTCDLDVSVRTFDGKLLIYKNSVVNNADFKKKVQELVYELQYNNTVKNTMTPEFKDFLSKYTALKNKDVDYLIIDTANNQRLNTVRISIAERLKKDNIKDISVSGLRGYGCVLVYHNYAQEVIDMMRSNSRKYANELKKQACNTEIGAAILEEKVWNHKVVSVTKDVVENVYDIQSVDETHTYGVVTNDGSGVFVHNCADRHMMPIELWTVGQLGATAEASMLPGPEMLEDMRAMITQATQQPPFVIVAGPYLKYEALGVSGKLLSIYDDLGYVENQILVGLGVNKNVVLAEGPSLGSSKTVALHRLIREYTTVRKLMENFFKINIILPIAKAHNIVDEKGEYIVPDIAWDLSLTPETDKENFDIAYKMWKDGLLSTETLYSKCPFVLDYKLEQQRLISERGSVFDKGDKRLGKKSMKKSSPEGGAGGLGDLGLGGPGDMGELGGGDLGGEAGNDAAAGGLGDLGDLGAAGTPEAGADLANFALGDTGGAEAPGTPQQ